jgi:hypothetical protein
MASIGPMRNRVPEISRTVTRCSSLCGRLTGTGILNALFTAQVCRAISIGCLQCEHHLPGPVSVRRSLAMAGRFQHVDTRFGCTQVPAFRALMAAM